MGYIVWPRHSQKRIKLNAVCQRRQQESEIVVRCRGRILFVRESAAIGISAAAAAVAVFLLDRKPRNEKEQRNVRSGRVSRQNILDWTGIGAGVVGKKWVLLQRVQRQFQIENLIVNSGTVGVGSVS